MQNVRNMRNSFLETIDKNIRPLSTSFLRAPNSKKQPQQHSMSKSVNMQKLPIQETHQVIHQACPEVGFKVNRNIIACLKSGKIAWDEYVNTANKTGQVAAKYLKKFKKIDERYQEQLNKIQTQGDGSLEKLKEVKRVFEDVINQLQRKAKKYMEHQAEMKVINTKVKEAMEVEENQEELIKEEMLELVEKFKKYAVQIQQDLVKDEGVIDEINTKQDQQLGSLKKKSQSMKQIIKDQKLGFFQLLAMGIIGIALWIFGLFIILII